MNFGPEFYVPILKAKRGEKSALQLIAPNIRSRLLPLLEIVERRAPPKRPIPSVTKHLATAFHGLATAVKAYPRYFLDCRELEPDGPTAAASAFSLATDARTVFTPVTGLSRAADVAAVLAHRDNGIAIRLTRKEFEAGVIPTALPFFMRKHSLRENETDLIVDLGAVDDMIAEGVEALAAGFLADVPEHESWRTLTVSACAFPQSMGGVDASSFDLVDRSEWRAWRDGLYERRGELLRLPSFSDCAIQHPRGVEGFDPRFMQVSAAARVARPDAWLLIKGVSTRNIPANVQFPGLARQLVYGHLREYFAGAEHCAGCAGMFNAANGAPRLGSPEVWRRLGTIHHLTTAVEAIARLSWP